MTSYDVGTAHSRPDDDHRGGRRFPWATTAEPPRYRLACLPTPLHRLPGLERELGIDGLWVKRDDLVGFALAGNKARPLEFLLGEALASDCDVLVTGGGGVPTSVRRSRSRRLALGWAASSS